MTPTGLLMEGQLKFRMRISRICHTMSRNFYVLAATLGFLALVSCGMTFVPSSFQPGLPANGSLWKTLSMALLLLGLVSTLIGSMSHLFEQVDRRTEERRRTERQRRRKNP
jgi:hypothetical protein